MTEPTEQDDVIASRIAYECSRDVGDEEVTHLRADEIIVQLLRDLGYVKTANAWDAVGKWYA